METTAPKAVTGIKSVGYYVAQPVECCDRCSQGIKYVYPVTWKDGTVQKFGMECINRVLNDDTSLKSLFKKNAKTLAKLKDYAEILSRPVDQMPRGHEYYNSGRYMVADSEGKDICFDVYVFHPIINVEKYFAGNHAYPITDVEAQSAKFLKAIEEMRAKLSVKIASIESFMARILSKKLVSPEDAVNLGDSK